MELTIRRATPADAAALYALGARTFYDAFASQNTAEDMDLYMAQSFSEAKQRAELESGDNVVLFIESDGVPAGYALLNRSAAPPAGLVDAVEIVRFYVDRPWHGRGVAQRLMTAVEGEAHAMGASTLWLGVWEHNARAIAFYTHAGFRDIGSHPFILGRDLQTDREMMKRLTP